MVFTVGYRASSEDQKRLLELSWEDLLPTLSRNIVLGLPARYLLRDLDRVDEPEGELVWENPDHEIDNPFYYEDLFEQDLHHPHNHHQRKSNKIIPKL